MKTKFNFKSQIATTKEQSERLIALGLKKETADMVHFFSQSLAQDWTIVPLADSETARYIQGIEIPAWSLGRLIEMALKDVLICGISFTFDEDTYEKVIGIIEYQIEGGYFNKEYLV